MDDPDEGSGTAALLGASGILILLLLVFLTAGQLRWAGSAAQTAADAAALAAADAARGLATGEPCEIAARIAEANRARLTGCTAEGDEATVTAAVSVLRGPLAKEAGMTVERTARAGPPGR